MCDINEFMRRMRTSDGPDWRWERAGALVSFDERPDIIDDVPTIVAWQYRSGSRPPDPAVAAAHAIYEENGPKKWEIEARLLTGVSIEEIAMRLGLMPGVVGAFTETFFDVQSRLAAHDWITLAAVRVGLWQPCDPSEADIWRAVAVDGGPAALDVLITDYHARPNAIDPARAELAEGIRDMIRLTCLPLGHPKFREVLKRTWQRLHARYRTTDPKQWWDSVCALAFLELAAGIRPRKPRISQHEIDVAPEHSSEQNARTDGSIHPWQLEAPPPSPDPQPDAPLLPDFLSLRTMLQEKMLGLKPDFQTPENAPPLELRSKICADAEVIRRLCIENPLHTLLKTV